MLKFFQVFLYSRQKLNDAVLLTGLQRDMGMQTAFLNGLMEGDDVLMSKEGLITKSDILHILPEIETLLDKFDTSKIIKRKIVNIAIESLQNLQIHSYLDKTNKYQHKPLFVLSKKGEDFYVSIGNLVDNKEIHYLKDKIVKINSLNNEEVKYLYSVIMKQTFVKFSDKGGAGLGLVDMKKKSGHPLQYHFSPIDADVSYFMLKVKIPMQEEN